jgi:hypothetical protein
MRKIIVTGLLFMVAVISASTLAEAGQAQSSWKTSVKITCDNSVPRGAAIGVQLCRFANCADMKPIDVPLECGTTLGMRSTGLRVESDFEPTNVIFTIKGFDQSGAETCSSIPTSGFPYTIGEVGSTVTCDGRRSPKLSVGRPH